MLFLKYTKQTQSVKLFSLDMNCIAVNIGKLRGGEEISSNLCSVKK